MLNVVVIGGGFGGLKFLQRARSSKIQFTLIDKQNHHLFQPLLYQVATAVLSPANICLLYTSPSPRDVEESRMPSSA